MSSIQIATAPNLAKANAILNINKIIKSASIYIQDITGRNVWNGTVSNRNEIDLPVNDFVSGIYTVEIILPNQKYLMKLIKE